MANVDIIKFLTDVIVSGDLVVLGNNTAESADQILVKGALTVINADNLAVTNTQLGTVIRTGKSTEEVITPISNENAIVNNESYHIDCEKGIAGSGDRIEDGDAYHQFWISLVNIPANSKFKLKVVGNLKKSYSCYPAITDSIDGSGYIPLTSSDSIGMHQFDAGEYLFDPAPLFEQIPEADRYLDSLYLCLSASSIEMLTPSKGSDYGIVYDPTIDSIRLGLGVYDTDNNAFTFGSGEGYPIAIRDLSAEDNGRITYWDAASFCLKSSPLYIKDGLVYIDDSDPSTPNLPVNALENIKLTTDLYTYTKVGLAQKASNKVITTDGSGSDIGTKNPGRLGQAGDTLKHVFDIVFGVEQDVQPNINTGNVKLTAIAGTTSYGSSTAEVGTTIPATDVTITFTLSNSATASDGYRCGTTKTKGLQTFYYPVTKQDAGNSKTADLKITLPSGKTATMVSGGGTLVAGANTNVLYCNFNDNKQVKIKIALAKGEVTTSSQTRYGQISATVKLGKAQKENSLTAGTEITKFLTYLGNDATTTSYYTGGDKSATAGAYTIVPGKYYSYYLASALTTLSTDTAKPVTTATRFTTETINIPCSDSSHIWFLMAPGTTGKKKIQYEPFSNTWVDCFGGDTDKTEGPTSVALKLESGKVITAVGYYTTAKAAADSNLKYKIINA